MPSSKKNEQLVDVFRRGANLTGRALVNVMKMKTKMTVSVRGPELREIEVRIEQTDHALRSMGGDYLSYFGEGAHDDLHELRRPRLFGAQVDG